MINKKRVRGGGNLLQTKWRIKNLMKYTNK